MKQPGIQQVQACYSHFAFRAVVTATKSVHRLQIRRIVHNYRAPPNIPPRYIRVRAVVWECGEGQTDRHTDGRDHYTFRLGYALRET